MKKLLGYSDIEDKGVNFLLIFKNIIFAFAISLGLLLIFSAILTYTTFPESLIPTVVLSITIISILIAAAKTSRHCKNRGWLIGGSLGITYIFSLYILSLIFIQRELYSSHTIAIFLFCTIAGSIGGIIGINIRKPERKHR